MKTNFYNKENPCLPNPCQNSGICTRLGSNGYVCSCPSTCTGYNCENCKINNLKLFKKKTERFLFIKIS